MNEAWALPDPERLCPPYGLVYAALNNTKSPGRRPAMNRRELLKGACTLPLVQTALANAAFAQPAWPARNVTMIVPFPAGGQGELAARPRAVGLERSLCKAVIA